MRNLGFKTLKLYWSWFRSRFIDHALILGYHRVAEIQGDPFSICVCPQNFKEQMEVLQKLANPISLDELAHTIEDGHLPPKAVVVTFDDGYADNLYEAKPLLEHYEIPAMVFIVSGSIGSQFWWDELKHILLSSKRLPEKLDISFNDFIFECNSENYSFESPVNDSFADRKQLLRTLYQKCLPLPFEVRKRVINQLRNWSDTKAEESSLCRTLTSDEMIRLVSGGLIEIGAHTVNHPSLSQLPLDEQRLEITQSKEALEKILNIKVKSFSYPHGFVSEETMAVVRKSGFICACASFNDVASRGSNRFKLPRFWIQDWDGKKFERWIKRWLNN